MWDQLGKPLAILLMVALPLAWGLGVEYAFELLRRVRHRGLRQDERCDE